MKTNICVEHNVIFQTHGDWSHHHTYAQKECFYLKILNEIVLILRKGALPKSVTWLCVRQVCDRVSSVLLVSQTSLTTLPRLVPRGRLLHASFSEKFINLLP